MVAYVNLRTMEKTSRYFTEVVAVTYGSGCLRELLIKDFETNQTGFNNHGCKLEPVAYQSGRKESFDCIKKQPNGKKIHFSVSRTIHIILYIFTLF